MRRLAIGSLTLVIALVKSKDFGIDTQFTNYRTN